jgi:serine/threonine protein kinase
MRHKMTFVSALDEVMDEIAIMKKLDHPSVGRLVEVIEGPMEDKMYLVMPMIDYGESMSFDNLTERWFPNERLGARNIKKAKKKRMDPTEFYDEDRLHEISKALVDALDYLHNSVKIVHRDIKP